MKAAYNHKEKQYNNVMNVMLNNLMIIIMVLHEQYGFGRERLDKFIVAVTKKVKEADEMAADEVYDLYIEGEYNYKKVYHERLREILRVATREYLPKEFYAEVFETPLPTSNGMARISAYREKERQKKTAVTLSQAAEMQRAAKIYQEFLKERSGKND